MIRVLDILEELDKDIKNLKRFYIKKCLSRHFLLAIFKSCYGFVVGTVPLP